MSLFSTIRTILLAGGGALALAACTQGDEIASPGPSDPGTPPGGNPGPGPGPGPSTDTCPTGFAAGTSVGGLTVCNVSGTILSNFTLPFSDSNGDGVGVAYRLNGRIDVGVDRGATGAGGTPATLTIAPGVTVFGASGADYIVVNRGSRIIADGTPTAPIVITSQNDLERQADSDPANDTGGSAIAEWGGLVLLGRAPINRCFGGGTPGTNSCQNTVEGVTNPEAQYGGDFAADNSGTLRYVQVRFAGFELSTGNELNGITLAGTGSGTVVDYVQVHNNADDGIEMFGGTTDLKHVVLTGNDDESFDTDNGWTGRVQYMVVAQRTDGGDNGMEMSSAGAGGALPTNPTIANFTMVTNRSNAFRINTGHIGRFLNGVVVHTAAGAAQCIEWASTAGNGTAGFQPGGVDPQFNSVLLHCGAAGLAEGDTAAATDSINADPNNVVGANSLSAQFFPGMNEQGVTAFDLTTLPGTFFDDTNYIGAFSPDETPTNNWATGWTFALFPEPTCPDGTTLSGEKNGVNVCSIAGVLTTDRTLTRGNIYELEGRIDVGVDVGANGAGGTPADLTIEAGVTVIGNSGADYIVVNRGSKLFANGTAQNPIILTSEADVDNPDRNDAENIAEWGGLVLLGRGPINRCFGGGTPGTNSCQNTVEGVTNPEAQYGGDFAADSSGSITYTQVKFAGFELSTGNELNGITFAGTGSGTVVDYVQVHNNADDGIEMFGGRTNLKHVVLTGNDDESFDTDNGWSGFVQYMLIVQRTLGGDNGMEMSSAGAGGLLPTDPTIANFTMVTNRSNAFRINTGHIGRFLNGVVTHNSAQCIEWATTAGNGVAGYQAGGVDPEFNSVLFDCNGQALAEADTAAAAAAIAADPNNNASYSDTLINTFINGPSETAATEFAPLSGIDAFFDDTDYVGAVKDTNDRWWAGWSCGLEASTPC